MKSRIPPIFRYCNQNPEKYANSRFPDISPQIQNSDLCIHKNTIRFRHLWNQKIQTNTIRNQTNTIPDFRHSWDGGGGSENKIPDFRHLSGKKIRKICQNSEKYRTGVRHLRGQIFRKNSVTEFEVSEMMDAIRMGSTAHSEFRTPPPSRNKTSRNIYDFSDK